MLSEEHKRKISESMKRRWREQPERFDNVFSEEARIKQANSIRMYYREHPERGLAISEDRKVYHSKERSKLIESIIAELKGMSG